jgi:glycosyltransferase involved in cell wall biosynthesis
VQKRCVAINGRFLAAPATGVQRVAEELIKHLDILLNDERSAVSSWTLFLPRNAARHLNLKNIAVRKSDNLTGHRWEQFELPKLATGQLLVNLCNQAPLSSRGGIVMIHDAQTFVSPRSYSWLFRQWYHFSTPRIGARAARVLTVSKYSRDRLIEYGVAPAGNIEVIYNGIDHLASLAADIRSLAKFGLTHGSYVVSLSNTQKHKNLAVLFDAFERLTATRLKLALVGAAGRAEFERMGISPPGNVVFCGKVSDAELRALYENAICLAFPSTTEGFGLPPLEAMLVGCPAVVAPCGALPEVCGEAAVYVAPDNPAEWANAINHLWHDVDARVSLIDKGRRRAADFTWQKSARQLLNIINDSL